MSNSTQSQGAKDFALDPAWLDALANACLTTSLPEGLAQQYALSLQGTGQGAKEQPYQAEHHQMLRRLGLSPGYINQLKRPSVEGINVTLEGRRQHRALFGEEVLAWLCSCPPKAWVQHYAEEWATMLEQMDTGMLQAYLMRAVSSEGWPLDEYLLALALTLASRPLLTLLLSRPVWSKKLVIKNSSGEAGRPEEGQPANVPTKGKKSALPRVIALWLLCKGDPILAQLVLAATRALNHRGPYHAHVQQFLTRFFPSLEQLEKRQVGGNYVERLELYWILQADADYTLSEGEWLDVLVPSVNLHMALDLLGSDASILKQYPSVRERVVQLLFTCPPELSIWQERYFHLLAPFLDDLVMDYFVQAQNNPQLVADCRTWAIATVCRLNRAVLQGRGPQQYLEHWIRREEEPAPGFGHQPQEYLEMSRNRRLKDLPLVAAIVLANSPSHIQQGSMSPEFYARVLFAAVISDLSGLQVVCLQQAKERLPELQKQVGLLGQMARGTDSRVHHFLDSAQLLQAITKQDLGISFLQALRDRDRGRAHLLWRAYECKAGHFEDTEDVEVCKIAASLIVEQQFPSLIALLPAQLTPNLLPLLLLSNQESICSAALQHFPLTQPATVAEYRQILENKGLSTSLRLFESTYPGKEQ